MATNEPAERPATGRVTVERLLSPSDTDFDALTDLWEASVRATHHFLAPGDIDFFKPLVRNGALPAAELYVIRREGRFAAFTGLEGDKIEMLFVAPDLRGKGLGRRLVQYAVERCGARRVDVNEQNTAAAGFYARMGFRTVARDTFDPSGHPYPILHLEL